MGQAQTIPGRTPLGARRPNETPHRSEPPPSDRGGRWRADCRVSLVRRSGLALLLTGNALQSIGATTVNSSAMRILSQGTDRTVLRKLSGASDSNHAAEHHG